MDAVKELINKSKSLWTLEEERRVIEILKSWAKGVRKDRRAYHLFENYTIQTFTGIEKIVTRKKNLVIATKENAFSVVHDMHNSCGQKGDRGTHKKIRENYANISRAIVEAYIRQCERCTEKLKKKENKGIVIRPILAKDFNERAQVDLVDFQSMPDGDFNYVLHYQDHLTKYHLLRPLPCKTASNVAKHVYQIFIGHTCTNHD